MCPKCYIRLPSYSVQVWFHTFRHQIISDDFSVCFRLDKVMDRVTNDVMRSKGQIGPHVVTSIQDHAINVNDHQEPTHCLKEKEGREGVIERPPNKRVGNMTTYLSYKVCQNSLLSSPIFTTS